MFCTHHMVYVNLLYINLGHPVIINFINPCRLFTIYNALGVFRYVYISPDLLTLTLLLKLLCDHPCNPLSFLPGTMLQKLVFNYEDVLDYIIIQGA